MKYHGKSGVSKGIVAPRSHFCHGPFGRLFRKLDPWEPAGATPEAKMQTVRELAEQMKEPEGAEHKAALDNKKIPAGYTYFGQFVDHDITFDPTSSLDRQNDPDRLVNFRTPCFDLDNIYGRGSSDQPYLYDKTQPGKLLIGDNGQGDEDLPRNGQDTALIGDMRNDENTLVSQLQLAFLKFHNAVLDDIGAGSANAFEEAQKTVRWHYQWVVVHDFLKRLCGTQLVDHLLNGGSPGRPRLDFYRYTEKPFMPVEFSVAAYRLGHSMVRPSYKINNPVPEIPIFDKEADHNSLGHLGGFRKLPGQWSLQWSRFVDFGGSNLQLSRRLDTKLARPLTELPGAIDGENRSLAFLNLMRGWRMQLPSGQAVAKCMGIEPIDHGDTPLWIYILNEADQIGGGTRLGEVGARIVAEVFIGLLAADPSSYYRNQPDWTPTLPKRGDDFELRDVLAFAGVDVSV